MELLRYDEAKFTEMLLYVAGRLLDDRAGGATKLNKVLFFAEFTHFRRHGSPISGCEFLKLQQGPAPRRLLPVRERLVSQEAAEIRVEDFLGRTQHRLAPLREPISRPSPMTSGTRWTTYSSSSTGSPDGR